MLVYSVVFQYKNIGINIPFSLSSSVEAFSFFTLFSFFTTALSELEVFALVGSFEASIKKMNISIKISYFD